MSIGLCEEIGFQPSSKLSASNDDERSGDGSAFQMAGMKICATRNAGDWDADVAEVGRTVRTDTVKCRDCYFELYLFTVALGASEARREEPA